MNKELKRFNNIAQAISMLLHPHAEVVIHDLKTERIAALFNNMSKRKVGDESLLEDLGNASKIPDVFPLYFKTNWDGRRMKCVTAALKDAKQKPIGLLCINVDLSKWEEMHRFILDFIHHSTTGEQPKELFKNDWREKINLFVTEYLRKESATLNSLTKEQKRQLIFALHSEGAFQAKNAAAYIAEVIGMSRASIYNYLRSK